MITLYETRRGDFAPAQLLEPAEAVSAYRSGHLLAADMQRLPWGAREAVRITMADDLAIDPSALVVSAGPDGRLRVSGAWMRQRGAQVT